MIKKIALAAALAFSSVTAAHAVVHKPPTLTSGAGPTWLPWTIIGCAGGVVIAALAKNYSGQGELTQAQAMTCGAYYWINR